MSSDEGMRVVGTIRSIELHTLAAKFQHVTPRQVAKIQQGIPSDTAKDIVKYLKDAKLKKVQASIQGDQLRITSGSKDDLQEVMRLLREQDFVVALQFGNYRG